MYLLSGGQKSRVAFALCVFNNPHILILDEPTKLIFIFLFNLLIIISSITFLLKYKYLL